MSGRTGRGYVSELHVVGIVTLAVVTGALALVGWSIRPESGGFPSVPSDLGVLVVSPPTAHLTEDLTLSPGGGATLQLLDLDVTAGSWTIDLNFIGAGQCAPRRRTSWGWTAGVHWRPCRRTTRGSPIPRSRPSGPPTTRPRSGAAAPST